MAVDLVDDRQEIIRPFAFAPMNLVHADGLDAFEFAVGQAPLHKPLHRAIDAFPTGAKDPCRLPPRQPPRPAGQKTHHGDGHRPLALTPRHMLHHHAVFRAADPPSGVEKPRHDAPQRHKEPGALLQSVIARSGLEATGTLGEDARVRLDSDFDATGLAIPMAVQANVAENESGKTLNRVQNGFNLQLNSWSPGRVLALSYNSHLTRNLGDQLFPLRPGTPSRRLWAGAASGGDGLPNSSSRRRRSPRVTDSLAPAHRRAPDVQRRITQETTHKLCYRPLFVGLRTMRRWKLENDLFGSSHSFNERLCSTEWERFNTSKRYLDEIPSP